MNIFISGQEGEFESYSTTSMRWHLQLLATMSMYETKPLRVMHKPWLTTVSCAK